jgi:hypothetical protein
MWPTGNYTGSRFTPDFGFPAMRRRLDMNFDHFRDTSPNAVEGLSYANRRPKLGRSSSVIDLARILPDSEADFIGDKLRRFRSIDAFNRQKLQLRRDLDQISPYFGYKGWWADPRDYHLYRVGESFQYDVPLGKRGQMAAFQGKRVRLFCLFSGKFRRWIWVGPANPLDVE